MASHSLPINAQTLHDYFSPDLPPVLTIDSGDTVTFQTLDAAWGAFEQPDPFAHPTRTDLVERERQHGHALCGPVFVRGAEPGMTLEVRLKTIRTGTWGWSSAGGFPSDWNEAFGVADGEKVDLYWALDPDAASAVNQKGYRLAMRPFMGIMGMPPAEPGSHPTRPPRPFGGNIDCKELVQTSRLFLPIAVPGALFSTGDGHAVQGDGELAGPAIECPMQAVEIEFHLHPDLHLAMPRAETPAGWITFGFHEDLNQAYLQAASGMLDLLQEQFGFSRSEALNYASLVCDLHITQVVNLVRGVHCILPHGVITPP